VTLTEPAAETILDRFGDLENYPYEAIAPYEEFRVGPNTYYFTPGGLLYCKDPSSEEVGSVCCGYVPAKVWHYRTDDS